VRKRAEAPSTLGTSLPPRGDDEHYAPPASPSPRALPDANLITPAPAPRSTGSHRSQHGQGLRV
jgi:hypothetical protein